VRWTRAWRSWRRGCWCGETTRRLTTPGPRPGREGWTWQRSVQRRGVGRMTTRPDRYLRCTGCLDSLPEAPNCCESCLEDGGAGDGPSGVGRPPALPGGWALDAWVVCEGRCAHLWWLKSLDGQEQRRVVARWLRWRRRQRGERDERS